MKPSSLLTPTILIAFCFLFQSCCRTHLHFSGKVVDKNGKGLANVIVKIGETEAKTKEQGTFEVCVDKAQRYVLNASLLKFGHVSKIYTDTSSHVVITMAKATVVTVHPNETQNTVIQDMHPDMTSIAPKIASPIDTIPFVYDAQGRLVGFTRPPAMVNVQKALANFQPPVLGARIEIPANSLVFEGTERKPDGDMEVSLNTVDIYSSDGMPGDYTVDGEKGSETGYMVPYGAANIEAFYNGQSLQLAPNQKATLTIPVDTLAIIAHDAIPPTIPLMVYDRTTGHWKIEGTAYLDSAKTHYTAQISHFSTYNMDLFKTTPSCMQICTQLFDGTSGVSITATNATIPKTTVRNAPTDVSPCAAGRCALFGSAITVPVPGGTAMPPVSNAGIINMPNMTNATITVTTGGSTVGTYIINSGPQPAGSPATYQTCDFNTCAGPFYITDTRCWENKDATPQHNVTGMNAPVMTFQQSGTNELVTWIFAEGTSAGVITNQPTYYEIEYQTFTPPFSGSLGSWTKVILAGGTTDHFPTGATGNSVWNPAALTCDFSTINTPLPVSDVLLFRVNAYVNTAEPGSAANINPTNLGVISIKNFHLLSTGDKSSVQNAAGTAGGPTCSIIID